MYAETPFMQQVHEGAYDFTRFTVLGHRCLFKYFEKNDSGGIRGRVVLAGQSAFIQGMIRNNLIAKICLFLSDIFWLSLKRLDPNLHDANSVLFFR